MNTQILENVPKLNQNDLNLYTDKSNIVTNTSQFGKKALSNSRKYEYQTVCLCKRLTQHVFVFALKKRTSRAYPIRIPISMSYRQIEKRGKPSGNTIPSSLLNHEYIFFSTYYFKYLYLGTNFQIKYF